MLYFSKLTSALYQLCEARSRVDAHLSKTWRDIVVGRSFEDGVKG